MILHKMLFFKLPYKYVAPFLAAFPSADLLLDMLLKETPTVNPSALIAVKRGRRWLGWNEKYRNTPGMLSIDGLLPLETNMN